MKVVFGPEDMVFNKVTSPIVDDTLELIGKYQEEMFELNRWLNASKKEIKDEYEKRYAAIVARTETAIQKFAGKVTK